MMEAEGEGDGSYSVAMRDTVTLYDTLLYGIELPVAIVTAINRKAEQYYISEEYKFRVEREKRESERKKIEAEGIRDFQQIVSQGISDSYLRWRGIEATLQLSQSTNSKVVIIGSGKDGLPIILGNVDSPTPSERGTPAIQKDPNGGPGAAGLGVPWERTPAAGLPTPAEQIPTAGSTTPAAGSAKPAAGPANPAAGTAEEPRSSWTPSLSDIEAFLSRLVRPSEPKAESASKPPAENPVTAQPR